ncbi:MAG: NUDIX hydrolase [Candidatus Binatia bacterium]
MTEPHPPKNAATVILLRPEVNGGIEVFMTRRPPGMDFLGGMYVFPGGSIRKEDCSEEILRLCHGLSCEDAQRTLGPHLSPDLSLGHWVAGIRELFEEVGILLCVTEAGKPLDMLEKRRKDRITEKRKALIEGSVNFRALLVSEGLLCDVARLAYFSHWVTPEEFSTRFDTRFYLALLPADQSPLATSQEVTHSLWITPERALNLCQQGSLPVIFPTFASLRTLANFDSLQSLLAEYGLKYQVP